MAVELDTVDGLRVHKYPPTAVNEFPAAIIRDSHATNQTAAGEYRSTSPVAVYHLEVLIIMDLADEQEAYEELEKYISSDSPSSVKTLMDGVTVTGYTTVECSRAEPRRLHQVGGGSHWGFTFWVRGIVT